MAENLLALLLVTSSARGSNLVFRWPPSPTTTPRYRRARPGVATYPKQVDNPWRASNFVDVYTPGPIDEDAFTDDDDGEYQWKRPHGFRDRSLSFPHPSSHPASGRNSPSQEEGFHPGIENRHVKDEYDDLLGFSSEFLAGLLCPTRSLSHQKFELRVDDLVFLGHPVCVESDGLWRFKPEKIRHHGRGREVKDGKPFDQSPIDPERNSSAERDGPSTKSAWLQNFHFVVVLDLPDPSSSASGNISKYFDIIYEQIAFTVAAVLFQEQVLSNFVEAECDTLVSLKESCIDKGEPLSDFIDKAMEASSIAPAMKAIYEAIKTNTMAYVTIHYLPLELQLPPFIDKLLHSDEDDDLEFKFEDDDDLHLWGPDMRLGWRLPSLAPWKSLLLLDSQLDIDPYMNLRGPHVSMSDRTLADSLLKFLETSSVTLSLANMAAILEWDLETQVFPTVRWLVLHRRAKVVDVVHPGLKTVFTLPPQFDRPLASLTIEFSEQFPFPDIPSLPQILAAISCAASKQTDNHFFASVVGTKELIPTFHDVLIWMLKRDLLVALHLRIRVIATADLKARAKARREQRKQYRNRGRKDGLHRGSRLGNLPEVSPESIPKDGTWLSMSPKSARRYSKRVPSTESTASQLSELIISESNEEDSPDISDDLHLEDDSSSSSDDDDGSNAHLWPSVIIDPGRATTLERRWLTAMSEGKEHYIARRFEHISQYFDGKRTDDEILYRANVTRKELREVLHLYDEYLETFLHPS
ncbi:hypothetical protein HGRIS_003780 [Hohenbuehelia grisea]|uniref:Nitrogen permease regulator 3 n=1 Tax=Hohenbuehelia grisea TaxID=104357 RepID=A0ABR3JI35_9AGAR